MDAENVRRSQWPNIPAEGLVELTCNWAERQGVHATIVFDGPAPGGHEGEHCVVVGTKGQTADDWIAQRAAELRAGGKKFWLVTSDRGLREAAGEGAERTIGGGKFANELRPR